MPEPEYCIAVRDALIDGKPLTDRVTTVTGMSLKNPGNRRVMLGTPIGELLSDAAFDDSAADRVIHGGPMMGFAVTDLECPSLRLRIVYWRQRALRYRHRSPSKPVFGAVCVPKPARITSATAALLVCARKDNEQLERHNLLDCIGAVLAYVCPSHIPLVQYYRSAKGAIREAAKEKVRSDNSRARFEARQNA